MTVDGSWYLILAAVLFSIGAIVVLFLFVIMLLGVDREKAVEVEELKGQRPLAVGVGVLVLLLVILLARANQWATGIPSARGVASGPGENVEKLGRSIFTDFLLPFEVTAVLLVIAVVGAVVLARRSGQRAEGPSRSPDEEAVP